MKNKLTQIFGLLFLILCFACNDVKTQKSLVGSTTALSDSSVNIIPAETSATALDDSSENVIPEETLMPKQFQGSGTAQDPYLIHNANDLTLLAKLVNSGNSSYSQYLTAHYKLMADITITDTYTPIGIERKSDDDWAYRSDVNFFNTSFRGTFDGNGFAITIKKMDQRVEHAGIFGHVVDGQIFNLGARGSWESAATCMGGIVGELVDFGAELDDTIVPKISNCYVKGSLRSVGAEAYVGGIVGHIGYTSSPSIGGSASVKACRNRASINVIGKNSRVGGVAGAASCGVFFKCRNFGKVVGQGVCVGGIVGIQSSYVGLSQCVNEGEVSGLSDVGGIVGVARYYISNCSNAGTVAGESNVGGIVGASSEMWDQHFDALGIIIARCRNAGAVVGTKNNIGGIVGYSEYSHVRYCYNFAPIHSDGDNVGGIMGYGLTTIAVYVDAGESEPFLYKSGDVYRCYNIGNIGGRGSIGGVVGNLTNDVSDGSLEGARSIMGCYNVGSVDGVRENNSAVGGIVGTLTNLPTRDVASCYYLNTALVRSNGYGEAMDSNTMQSPTLIKKLNSERSNADYYYDRNAYHKSSASEIRFVADQQPQKNHGFPRLNVK